MSNLSELLGTGGGASSIIKVTRTSDVTLEEDDIGAFVDITSGSFTQTFRNASTLGDGWFVYLRNSGTGDITIEPDGTETIDGLSSFILYPREVRIIQCDGTSFTSILTKGGYKEFTSSGTFIAPPGVTGYVVAVYGGGGGGGSGKGDQSPPGGGGGAHNRAPLDTITAGTQVVVTVGAGGAGGESEGNGVTGGTSSFGDYLYAYGGAGGTNHGSGGGGTARQGPAPPGAASTCAPSATGWTPSSSPSTRRCPSHRWAPDPRPRSPPSPSRC